MCDLYVYLFWFKSLWLAIYSMVSFWTLHCGLRLALCVCKPGFEKIIKLIDDLTAKLPDTQKVDEEMKNYYRIFKLWVEVSGMPPALPRCRTWKWPQCGRAAHSQCTRGQEMILSGAWQHQVKFDCISQVWDMFAFCVSPILAAHKVHPNNVANDTSRRLLITRFHIIRH